jgi:hypothetical protein
VLTFVSSSGLSAVLGGALPADGRGTQSARFGAHPADIPRPPPFTVVRRRAGNGLTCHDSSPESAEVCRKHVRNVEVGGSSPHHLHRRCRYHNVLAGQRRCLCPIA